MIAPGGVNAFPWLCSDGYATAAALGRARRIAAAPRAVGPKAGWARPGFIQCAGETLCAEFCRWSSRDLSGGQLPGARRTGERRPWRLQTVPGVGRGIFG